MPKLPKLRKQAIEFALDCWTVCAGTWERADAECVAITAYDLGVIAGLRLAQRKHAYPSLAVEQEIKRREAKVRKYA